MRTSGSFLAELATPIRISRVRLRVPFPGKTKQKNGLTGQLKVSSPVFDRKYGPFVGNISAAEIFRAQFESRI